MRRVSTTLGRLGVTEQGDGDATPILFLHGVGSDRTVWAPQLAHFGATRRAVAFDFPGYGQSEPITEDADRDDVARWFAAGLEALGIERAHICGLSLGGVMAIAMHAVEPERCASLIIANSFARHPDGQAIYDRSVAASRELGLRALAEQRAPLLLAATTPEPVRRQVVETMAAIDPAAYRTAARAVWLADQSDRVRRIEVPTLVLVGSGDPVTPPALSRQLAELVPGASYVELAGASHLSNLDQPAAFNLEVERFLSEVERESQGLPAL